MSVATMVEPLERRMLLSAAVAAEATDPAIEWMRYLSGWTHQSAGAIVADGEGNFLVTGHTESHDIQDEWDEGFLAGAFGGTDVFVAKVSSTGSLLWVTYLGGVDEEFARSSAVDAEGNIFVAGRTWSSTFSGAINGSHGTGTFHSAEGTSDAFLAKISHDGTLQWMRYLGGTADDYALSVLVDPAGDAIVTGDTYSHDFEGAINSFHGRHADAANYPPDAYPADAFAAKVSSHGEQLWMRYLGGEQSDSAAGSALDGRGDLVLAMNTRAYEGVSSDYRAGSVIKMDHSGEVLWTTQVDDLFTSLTVDRNDDLVASGFASTGIFVLKLTAEGSPLWTTSLGGNADDRAFDARIDGNGNTYIVGRTSSAGVLAATNSYHGGTQDAIAARISAHGTLDWSLYIGGGDFDEARAFEIDAAGNLFVAGWTQSTDFSGAVNDYHGGSQDGFAAGISTDGIPTWIMYIGGSDSDHAFGSTMDPSGHLMIAGTTSSGEFDEAITEPYANPTRDGFVLRMAVGAVAASDVPSPSLNPDGHLTVMGTDEDDQILISRNGPFLVVTHNGINTPFANSDVTAITIHGLEGHDWIEIGPGIIGATIHGNQGDDTIIGGDGGDLIYAGKGNDSVEGRMGPDRIYGGEGNDTLRGGKGHDHIWGGPDDDLLYAGRGDNRLTGEAGNDTLFGGDGNNILWGGWGDDWLHARYASADTLFGGPGNDTAEADPEDQINDIEQLLA